MLTRRPFDADGKLDSATALVLPSNVETSHDLIAQLSTVPADAASTCVGLWMGTPFPVNTPDPSECAWVCNFPSTTMFDTDFAASLSEVRLGFERENAHLRKLHNRGFKTLCTVAVGQNLEALQRDAITAMLVVVRSAVDLRELAESYAPYLRKTLGSDVPLVIYGGIDRHLPRAPEKLTFDAVLEQPTLS